MLDAVDDETVAVNEDDVGDGVDTKPTGKVGGFVQVDVDELDIPESRDDVWMLECFLSDALAGTAPFCLKVDQKWAIGGAGFGECLGKVIRGVVGQGGYDALALFGRRVYDRFLADGRVEAEPGDDGGKIVR
jgi:hypothetical protein